MEELWYKLNEIPDLTLNKYASLEGNGVDGVIEKHIAFLRQLNRIGIVSGLSFHLYYLYVKPEEKSKDTPGKRLQIFLSIRGKEDSVQNVPALIEASPLADFYHFESKIKHCEDKDTSCSIRNILSKRGVDYPSFNSCAVLTKSETLLPSETGVGEDYYILRDWEMNEDGRLYNMCKMMESLNRTSLYRVDLYPVERSVTIRDSLRKPMGILRRRQDNRDLNTQKDYDGRDVLENYENLIEKYDSSPHFLANIMVFAENKSDATSILDAAGAESLLKGKYSIATFASSFSPYSFLDDSFEELENLREKTVLRKGKIGLIVCSQNTLSMSLNYLPTLFSLEEIAPFFRLPALYDGEIIQIPKETAPVSVDKEGSLFLGKDKNGYDVYFPLYLLPKHAFVSGVPGSGKTNTMHHITSSLWKDHRIPFLVLEPAKQEYRALANDPEMRNDLYVFSPNADMSFPLHINPFEMPKGTLVAEHIRRLCSVFEGAFPLDPPMPFLVDTAIEAVYRELGWIPEHIYLGDEVGDNGKKRPLPTMSMLYRRLEQELETTKYSDEVRGNLESALKVRIGSLLRREMGDVFDVPYSTFTPERWLEVPAVIELESMGTGPANFLTLMLCSLIRETLKANPVFDGDIRHVIFIEEAHNLIGPESEESSNEGDPKQAATAFVVKMLAEVRALKEGIVIADQLPTVMAQEVLKNTGLKIGLRITSADDRSVLGSTMAASSLQLEQMSTFAVGEALIFYEKLLRPFTMRVKEWFGEVEDKKLKNELVTPRNDANLREALESSDTYIEANSKSIRIMLQKFFGFYSSLEPIIKQEELTIKRVDKLFKMVNQRQKFVKQAEQGVLECSSDQLKEEKEYLEQYTFALNDQISKAAIDKHFNVISELCNYAFTIDRLRKGRWSRFKASLEDVKNILILERKFSLCALNLYDNLIEVAGEKNIDLSQKQEIDRVLKINQEVELKLINLLNSK